MWDETRRIFLESLGHVARGVARVLPSVFAMLMFVVLAAALAVVVRWIVLRACERLALDRRLREWGVAAPASRERPGPSRLVGRVSFWAVLLAGAFLGVSVLDTPAATALSMRLVEYVPRAVVALATLGVGLAAARFVERNVLIGAVNMGLQSARLLALGTRWLVLLVAAAVALDHAGVGATVVTLAFGTLFAGIVLALALAVGLGARDLVARSLERHFREGRGPAGKPEEDRPKVHHL
jgi:hypothetical protein